MVDEDTEGRARASRERMVQEQLVRRGISDERVLQAFHDVPRHLFVPTNLVSLAYEDRPLKLGPDQTISQPYIVALMLEHLKLRPDDKVLEIGTGSGFQTALISELCSHVYSVEYDQDLSERAGRALKGSGSKNHSLFVGDGWQGLPQDAPFDKIIVSAACDRIPRELVRQLHPQGVMIFPLGTGDDQTLVLLEKNGEELLERTLGNVRFVPLKHH